MYTDTCDNCNSSNIDRTSDHILCLNCGHEIDIIVTKQGLQQKPFIKQTHYEKAETIFRGWPKWKQDLYK